MSIRSSRRIGVEYAKVLTDIFEIMLACGLPKKHINAVVVRALKSIKTGQERMKVDLPGHLATMALILDAWHRNHHYLNNRGIPRAIPLLGAAPSLEALICAESIRTKSVAMAHRLKAMRLVVPCGNGLYKPSNSSALLSTFDPIARQHVARSLSMLLETIRQNLALRGNSKKLIERIAEVPDLPLEHVQSFRRFTQIQGWILLRTVNDWLESRRGKSANREGKSVRAGIHVHSYLGSPRSVRSTRKVKRRAPPQMTA